jgi:hypothetical protein
MSELPTETAPSDTGSNATQANLARLMKYLPVLAIGHTFVTVPAFVISMALAYATFVQADATRKMQQSESWPYVSYGTSDITDEGVEEISFKLGNDGVGPARLKQLEFRYDGRPMKSPRKFLQTCCGDPREHPTPFMSSKFEVVLRPGEVTSFIRLVKRPDNNAVWNRLEIERWKVAVRACYCSIFDDCWVLDSRVPDPSPVKKCPADWARFEERPAPIARP